MGQGDRPGGPRGDRGHRDLTVPVSAGGVIAAGGLFWRNKLSWPGNSATLELTVVPVSQRASLQEAEMRAAFMSADKGSRTCPEGESPARAGRTPWLRRRVWPAAEACGRRIVPVENRSISAQPRWVLQGFSAAGGERLRSHDGSRRRTRSADALTGHWLPERLIRHRRHRIPSGVRSSCRGRADLLLP